MKSIGSVLIGLLAATPSTAGERMDIGDRVYGDAPGCVFALKGELPADGPETFSYISSDRIGGYEFGCEFIEVTPTIRGWSVKAACETEGDKTTERFEFTRLDPDTILLGDYELKACCPASEDCRASFGQAPIR